MAFKKGEPRPENAGRKKGRPNKKKLLRVDQILAEKGVNPVEKILELVGQLDPDEAIKVWQDLIPYYNPKIKDVELTEFAGLLQDNEAETHTVIKGTETADLISLVQPSGWMSSE